MSNQYQQVLDQNPCKLTDQQVQATVKQIIDERFDENNTVEVYKKIYSCIDFTTLNSTDSREEVWRFTEKVNAFEETYPELENVAAICVYPNFAKTVKEALTVDARIACVSGGFPTSQTFVEVKIAETALAVSQGADEIDVVINLGLFLEKEYEEFCEELMEIKAACHEAKLKIILETGALKTAANIYKASMLALYSGADFLKTSTGKGYPGATPEAAYVMCSAIKAYYEKTGNRVGFKVSGGVASAQDAVSYYTLVKEVLGQQWCDSSLFRIGASRLADTLLGEIVAG